LNNEHKSYYKEELNNQFKIFLAGIALSAERLSKHISILGGTGSGKTLLLRQFIVSACLSLSARAIIFDNKGDFTSTLTNNRKKRPIIIGPYDKRSSVPDIAFDCSTRAEAFEFGLTLFPEKKREEMWDKGARLMLTGVIITLQNQYKTQWGWQTLKDELSQCLYDPKYFHQILMDNFPESAGLIQFDDQGNANETTQSLLISINAEMRSIIELADAYENNPNPKFSIKKFIHNKKQNSKDKYLNNVVILQGNSAMEKLQNTSIHFFLGYFIKLVASPSYPERPPFQDPIHLILDEFPQIGAMLFFKRILEVCRSKNIPTVFAGQSYAQFEESYGKEVTKIIFENCATRIIARSTDSTADWFIKSAGKGKFERTYQERDKKNQIRPGIPKIETDDIVKVEDLSTELGPFYENKQPKGIKFVLWAVDQQIYRLKNYFPTKKPKKIRKPFIPAPWCKDVVWENYIKNESEIQEKNNV